MILLIMSPHLKILIANWALSLQPEFIANDLLDNIDFPKETLFGQVPAPERKADDAGFCYVQKYQNDEMTSETKRQMRGSLDVEDHHISLTELFAKYKTDPRFGLTKAEAEARLAKHGKNVITPNKKGFRTRRFFRRVFYASTVVRFIMILISLFDIVLHKIQDDIAAELCINLLIMIFNNSVVGVCYYVQTSSHNSPNTLSINRSEETEVIRDGNRMKIPTEDIVVGDLVLLRYGEMIPADIRIFDNQNFKVDNFTLSGIHEPQLIQEKAHKEYILDSPNVVFFSAKAVEGTASGIVIRTGNETLLGTVFSGRKTSEKFICPVTKMIIEFLNNCAILSVFLSIAVLGIYLGTQGTLGEAIMIMTMLSLSVIPEDLFMAMLLSYKVQCKKLSSKNYCVITNILALQKLPFVKIICLNRPEILTLNKVTVSSLWFDRKIVEVWGGTKTVLKDRTSTTFKELTRCAVLCTGTDVKNESSDPSNPNRQMVGDVIEMSVLKFLTSTLGKKVERFRETYPKVTSRPYYINGRYQTTVHRGDDGFFVIMMGEPEHLLDKCTHYLMYGQNQPIGPAFLKDIDKACVTFAEEGNIIRGVITIMISSEYEDELPLKIPETGYTFLGLFTLSEMSHTKIADAIKKCKRAGIKVVLMTNNHPIMARRYARNIGVISERNKTLEEKTEEGKIDMEDVRAAIVDGKQLTKLSTKAIRSVLEKYEEVVFARMSPIQKLMVVASCQKSNTLVAVVGDVHEYLTMKKADLKISLTEDKTDSSEVKADVYISDDTFSALVSLIKESRAVFANLKKCTAYTITSNMAITLPIIIHTVVGLPLAINPYGLIIIELLFEFFPSVALVFERPDPLVMENPPPEIETERMWSRQMIFYSCLQIGMMETFACFFTFFVIMYQSGWSPLSLIFTKYQWNNKVVNDMVDIHGQSWSFAARKELQIISQTGYFFTLTLVQCVNMVICRNQRISSIRNVSHNWVIPFSVLFELSLMLFLIYLPNVNTLVQMRSLKPILWAAPVPYCFLIFIYDEVKKYIVRKYPEGWLARETVY